MLKELFVIKLSIGYLTVFSKHPLAETLLTNNSLRRNNSIALTNSIVGLSSEEIEK